MKTLLIPTDFSPAAENAGLYVLSLARQISIDRILLYDATVRERTNVIFVTDVLDPIIETQDLTSGQGRRLEDFRDLLARKNDTGVEITCLSDDRALEVVLPELVEGRRVDMVVCGINAFGDGAGQSIGKEVIKIAIKQKLPALIVPQNIVHERVQKVLLSCDLRKVAETIPGEEIKRFIKDLQAELFVVNVDYENTSYGPDNILEQSKLHLMFDELGAEYIYEEDQDIINGIIRAATTQKADLIISIPRERGVFERLFNPSITKRLIGTTPIPVLLLPSEASAS